ncbi:hypothetical protein HBH70_213930 [Parastagonospora nodorum]|nr:hypothetical protein HBH51_141140 [Parastagonospora nodorum]KAH4027005.1 hypothetical protein HBI09_146960 [Parastagonospora nodorum]KAH4817663.1 hypothetical protein HBH61_043830 [Parastagonospora nodorum]KAH4961361.1 hypothetical protein HBI78_145600 [Parastagonospora nodorum]KAH4976694.1 hypothetical protein HBI77_226210 [Parastagonospora nodorum]
MSTSQTIHNVALIGGTGSIGSHILKSLLSANKHTITVLTRTTSVETFPDSVSVKKVDYTSSASITSALTGQDFLIITLPGTAPPELHPRIVNAAAAAGVKYIMPNYYGFALSDRPSAVPADPLLNFERYVDDVRAVSSQGVKFIALACGFWYEWSLGMGEQWYGFDIAKRRVTFYDNGEKKINTSTWKLCGDAVASILSGDVDKFANKTVYISSFLISQRDMLDSLHRVLGTADRDWQIAYQGVEERYQEGHGEFSEGNRLGFAKLMYARKFYPEGDGDFETGWGVDNERLGLEREELDEATGRTVRMVEDGFGVQTWIETGKPNRVQ